MRRAQPGPWRRALPGVYHLSRYQRAWLRGDLLAGVTVAAYLIPQVMAYAQVARLPAVVGLWAVVVSLLVYAALGSSRQLSVGPESTTALLTATVVVPLAAGDPGRYAVLAAALAVAVGVVCLLAWLARLGFAADALSRPVLVGYLAGVGVIMIASQLGRLTGVPVAGPTVVAQLRSFVAHLDQLDVRALLLSLAVLAFLLGAAHRFPNAPVPLAGMLLATLAVAAFHLQDKGVRVVGSISSGVPAVRLPAVTGGQLASLLLPAVGVAIVAYTDNVLTARAFAARGGYAVDTNQELLALGACNVAAGFVQGFPVSSSGSRTVIGEALGSRSQLYSLVTVATVLATMLVGRPLLAAFPTVALGAIVVYAATRLVDLGEFRRIARFRRSELILALATTVAVLAVDILYGVLVAVGLSILDLLRRVARPHDAVLGYAPGVAGMHDIEDYPDARLVPGLLVYRYDAPLCFANAENFTQRARSALQVVDGPVEWFVLNAEANVEMDVTSADAVEELRTDLIRRGVVFAMARVKHELRRDLAAAGLLERIGEDRIFPTLPTAVEGYVAWYTERHGSPPAAWRSITGIAARPEPPADPPADPAGPPAGPRTDPPADSAR